MRRRDLLIGLAVAALLALLLSPFASPSPDGLERVASDKGFLEKGEGPAALAAPVADYAMPGIGNRRIATGVAGALGVIAVFGIATGLAAVVTGSFGRRRPATPG